MPDISSILMSLVEKAKGSKPSNTEDLKSIGTLQDLLKAVVANDVKPYWDELQGAVQGTPTANATVPGTNQTTSQMISENTPVIDLGTIRINAAKKAAAKQADLEVQQAIPQVGIEGVVQAANNMAQQQPVQQQDVSTVLAGQPTQSNVKQGLPDNVGAVESFFRMLGIGASPETELLRAQTEAVKQKIAGQEPMQAGEREKLEIEGEQELKKTALTNLYTGKISDVQKKQQTDEAFKTDITNLVNAWDNLGMKGAVGGRVGGLIAGTLGQVTGTGREARAKFESLSNGVLYSVGDYILGQSGRALVEADLKRLEKMAKFSPNMKKEDFKGKLQAILDFANSKITASGGTPTLTNAEQLMKHYRGKTSSGAWSQDKESRYQELLMKQKGR